MELKALQIGTHPHAIAVLMRVFLEISVDAYLVRHGIGTTARDVKSGKTYDKVSEAKSMSA